MHKSSLYLVAIALLLFGANGAQAGKPGNGTGPNDITPNDQLDERFDFPAAFAERITASGQSAAGALPPDPRGNSVAIAQLTSSLSTGRLAAEPAPRIARLSDKFAAPARRLPATEVQPAGFHDSSGQPLPEPPLAEVLPSKHRFTSTPRVSDTFVETDVRQAIQSLANQAHATVIMDDRVRGTVSATIDDEPFREALEQLLLPLGLVTRQVGARHYVGVAEPDSALFNWISERYRYRALHRDPAALVALLPERVRPFLRVSPHGGWLVVEAPQLHAEQILNELEELDQPVPQVVLEALICVYAPGAAFRFGFDLDSGVQLFDRATQVAISGLSLSGGIGNRNGLGNLNDFHVTSSVLRALEQEGYVKIRAAPRVMAQDGQKAQIHIGRETYFSIQGPDSQFLFRQDIQQVDSGIMLEIVPTVREPFVTVQIDRAEVSEDIRSDETQATSSDRFPVINRRSVSTTVQVADGHTIVIGGLTQRQKVDQVNKLPVLGDVPLVGKLFQRVEKIDQKAEVAIFISPRIVREGGEHAVAAKHRADSDADNLRY